MSRLKIASLVVVSIVIAILLASALTSFTRVSDSALADMSPSGAGRGEIGTRNRPSTSSSTNYLPIIFLNSATAGGAWLLAGNAGTNWASDFLGTTDNMTLTLRVSNTIAYRIVPAVNPGGNMAPNIIGGSPDNSVASGLHGATIAGGGITGFANVIGGSGNYAAIGGGESNTVNAPGAVVGGGYFNTVNGLRATVGGGSFNSANGGNATIGGGDNNNASLQYGTVGGGYANTTSGIGATVGGGGQDGSIFQGNKALAGASTIGGGVGNIISTTAKSAAIGGGFFNSASGIAAAIGGGSSNTASGTFATVPGGEFDSAFGNYSFAAGCGANANHPGAFVWVDSRCAVTGSTANNQFLVFANGGVGINTNSPHATLTVSNTNTITTADNTATFAALNIGPLYSHIHYGTTGDWYVRSASQSGKVILQDYGGNVGIGTSSPNASYALDVNGKVHASQGFSGTCRTDGVVAFGPVCNQDFAEAFAATQLTEPGDLVALVTDATGTPTVRKSTGAFDDLVIGVVSQNPGLVFDNGQTYLAGDNSQLIANDKTVVALVGRVKVKVSTENGAINIGDPLTSSSTQGIAMKATQAGKIIGYAMENAASGGTVLALVQPGDYLPASQREALKHNAELEAKVSAQDVRLAALESQSPASNTLTVNALALWGIVGLLGVLLARKRK